MRGIPLTALILPVLLAGCVSRPSAESLEAIIRPYASEPISSVERVSPRRLKVRTGVREALGGEGHTIYLDYKSHRWVVTEVRPWRG